MTDTQARALAEEYNRLDKLLAIEQSRPNLSLADIRYYEDKMARIEAKFQQADTDIMQWIT